MRDSLERRTCRARYSLRLLLLISNAFVKVLVTFAVLFVRVAIVSKLVFVIVFVRRRAVVRVEVESGGGAEEDGFAPLLSVEVVGVSSEYAGDSKE